MDLRLNLNLPQAPREPDPELNRALMPIYNALKLIQEGFQLTESGVTANEELIQQLNELVLDLTSRNYATLEDIPYVQEIHYSDIPPSTGEGKDRDLWITNRGRGINRVYANFSGTWRLLGSLSPSAVDTTAYLAWKGAWATTISYAKNSVVTMPDGAVYVALVTHTSSALNTPPDIATWKLLQEAITSTGGGVGEAVLSSRAPAVDPAPPNFVISRLGDLVYARTT